MALKWYLLKRGTTRNDLQRPEKTCNKQETTWKQPTTSKKRLETTHKEEDTTYNDLNLPTTSKKKTRNDQQQADFEIILQYGGNRFSSLRSFKPNILLQSFEYCFTENHC